MEQPQSVSAPAPKQKKAANGPLIAAVVLLVCLLAYYTWHRRYHSKPHCGDYGLGPAATCGALTKLCGADDSCQNAVAHCMPIISRASSGSAPGGATALGAGRPGFGGAIADAVLGSELKACTRAVANVDPQFAAALISQELGPRCLPGFAAAGLHDPEDYRAMLHVAQAMEPLLPWSVRVAKEMPSCPGNIAPPFTPKSFPWAPLTHPLAPVAHPWAPLIHPDAPVTHPLVPVTHPWAPLTHLPSPVVPHH